MTAPESLPSKRPPRKPENPFINLLFCIVIPALLLVKTSAPDRLGPVWSLVIALCFPLAYGLYDFVVRRTYNFVSILGFVSICLTGSIGLLKLEGFWFAAKEALIPGIIAIALLVSLRTRYPLVKTVLFNDKVVNLELVDQLLEQNGSRKAFERLLETTTYIVAASFVLSSVLHFILARIVILSAPGTTEFNQELGQLTAMRFPFIALPCTLITGFALWRLLGGIKKMTGLDLDKIFKAGHH